MNQNHDLSLLPDDPPVCPRCEEEYDGGSCDCGFQEITDEDIADYKADRRRGERNR